MRQRKPTSLADMKLIIGSIEVSTVMRRKITLVLTTKVFTAADNIAVIIVLHEKSIMVFTTIIPTRGTTMIGGVTGGGGETRLNGAQTKKGRTVNPEISRPYA